MEKSLGQKKIRQGNSEQRVRPSCSKGFEARPETIITTGCHDRTCDDTSCIEPMDLSGPSAALSLEELVGECPEPPQPECLDLNDFNPSSPCEEASVAEINNPPLRDDSPPHGIIARNMGLTNAWAVKQLRDPKTAVRQKIVFEIMQNSIKALMVGSDQDVLRKMTKQRVWESFREMACVSGVMWRKPGHRRCDECFMRSRPYRRIDWTRQDKHYLIETQYATTRTCSLCYRWGLKVQPALNCPNCIIGYWKDRVKVNLGHILSISKEV